MSKVVLLAVNSKYTHSSLSVWALAAGVSRYALTPHSVEVVEAAIQQSNEDIANKVAAHTPDVVGVSAYIWNASKLPELLTLLRGRLPGAVFVMGGPEASHNAEYWLARGADHVLRGEGEAGLPALLDIISDGVARDIPGPLSEWPDPYG
ncbi:MAG: cobalamin B12-binding domain-containing protein, partial [Oscillospiraceae bacterium]|nr:cobalamin B12-binding domain-containing protein [Oscillospiraceae bacterium]